MPVLSLEHLEGAVILIHANETHLTLPEESSRCSALGTLLAQQRFLTVFCFPGQQKLRRNTAPLCSSVP